MDEQTTPPPESPEPIGLPDLAQFRDKPRWGGAITTTVLLDLVGLAALLGAYSEFHLVELANGLAPAYSVLFIRLLMFAPLAQIAATVEARRKGFPWLVPAWALPFMVAALFAFLWGARSVSGLDTLIG